MIPKMFRVLCLVFGVSLFGVPFINAQEKESRLINTVPKHLPLKIEIINGDSADFLRDVKVRVTNTGEKPIYFLRFYISTPENFVSSRGIQYGFGLVYGRKELVTFTERSIPEDIPLRKGDNCTFSVDDNAATGFKNDISHDLRAEPETYLLEFIHLSFGDGTGFTGPKGIPFPSKKEASLLGQTALSTMEFFFFAIIERFNMQMVIRI